MPAGIRFNSSTLTGNKIEMYEVGKDEKPLQTFESMGKAGRACGYYNKDFQPVVRKRQQIEITYKGKKIKVYFKEK